MSTKKKENLQQQNNIKSVRQSERNVGELCELGKIYAQCIKPRDQSVRCFPFLLFW